MVDDAAPLLPGSPGAPLWDPLAVPAATVIVLRDAPGGPEVLMLQRDRGLSFAGGMWVFPGGRIDDADRTDTEQTDTEHTDTEQTDTEQTDTEQALEAAARRAAVREAREESGVVIDPSTLRRWTHWTPPPLQDKRFSTAFFVAPAVDAATEVVIDDAEIRAHQWSRPDEAIARRDAGEIALAPPTFITLTQLVEHRSVDHIVESAATRTVEHFSTRVALRDGGWTAVYHGDVVFAALGEAGGMGEVDLRAPGPRHRLLMEDRWTYLREGC
ncbi:MAG: NUDIX domain-containing protein [Actinobacteria bacterium]|nr:NUDIX domain-containing protein [Actinomycetota bacterium]